jgi:predicted metal-binding protein
MDQSVPAAADQATSDSQDRTPTLHVCITCLAGEDRETVPRAGARLHDALVEAQRGHADPTGFRIVATECLSNCNRGVSVALTGPERWSYVYGDLTAAAVDDLIAGAKLYAATTDGLVPWRERPTIFRKGVIARIPPAAQPL